MARVALARKRCRRRGTAIVETAIVLPILILVLFGIIEFGRVMSVRHTMTTAVTEGARQAIVDGATDELIMETVQQSLDGANMGDLGITVNAPEWEAPPGLGVTVSAQIPYVDISLFAGFFLSEDFILRSSTTMFRTPSP